MSNEFINIDSANANSSPEHFQLRYISISNTKVTGSPFRIPITFQNCSMSCGVREPSI